MSMHACLYMCACLTMFVLNRGRCRSYKPGHVLSEQAPLCCSAEISQRELLYILSHAPTFAIVYNGLAVMPTSQR